eukprot:Hpha_TRINITY_DN16070_c0_g1::TRINITY_DN16070_c0_g1_i7::g.119768::m.119768
MQGTARLADPVLEEAESNAMRRSVVLAPSGLEAAESSALHKSQRQAPVQGAAQGSFSPLAQRGAEQAAGADLHRILEEAESSAMHTSTRLPPVQGAGATSFSPSAERPVLDAAESSALHKSQRQVAELHASVTGLSSPQAGVPPPATLPQATLEALVTATASGSKEDAAALQALVAA